MKNSYQAQKVIEEVIKEKPKARWLFLTLSTKKCDRWRYFRTKFEASN
ncbi:hypothetical protein BER47_002593 [Staphylococcus aureus]|nr:hypothetical protein BER47_002593 [Staphylococcus aureus]